MQPLRANWWHNFYFMILVLLHFVFFVGLPKDLAVAFDRSFDVPRPPGYNSPIHRR